MSELTELAQENERLQGIVTELQEQLRDQKLNLMKADGASALYHEMAEKQKKEFTSLIVDMRTQLNNLSELQRSTTSKNTSVLTDALKAMTATVDRVAKERETVETTLTSVFKKGFSEISATVDSRLSEIETKTRSTIQTATADAKSAMTKNTENVENFAGRMLGAIKDFKGHAWVVFFAMFFGVVSAVGVGFLVFRDKDVAGWSGAAYTEAHRTYLMTGGDAKWQKWVEAHQDEAAK